MWRTNRRRILAMGTATTALALLGASGGNSLLGKKKEPPLKAGETIGDLANVRAASDIQVEGVGLVIGLDDTGSDPGPSVYRTKLLDQMRKAQVPRAEQILASKSTSLVVVRGRIPIGVSTEDVFDVSVELPSGSTTTSLAGGKLLKTELALVAVANGQILEGKILATAGGPVLPGSLEDPDDSRAGRVLGGARARQEMPYMLVIKANRKGVRTATLIESAIASRFFYLDGVNQKGMAEAKTDEYLTLKVPQTYHQNQARYFDILQLLPIVTTPELLEQRLAAWGEELLDPKTAGRAALKLEGIGPNASEVLKKGLASDNSDVQFFAAEALAYLNKDDGVEVLAEVAKNRAEYRAFAFAAMASTDQAASIARLRELMAHPDPEIRYGAFNALRTLDEDDWALGKVRVFRDPEPTALDDDDDSMAYQIAVNRRSRPADPFALYLVDCDGPPLIHASNSRRAEIVVFGRSQKLLPPIVLGNAGSVLLNASLNDDRVQISRIGAATLDGREPETTASLDLGDVIREAATLGATYPEIVAILQAAERQRNLEGPLVIDALPTVDEAYEKAQFAGILPGSEDDSEKADEAVQRTSADESRPRGIIRRFLQDRRKGR